MALLTTPYDPTFGQSAVQSAIRLSAELREQQAARVERAKQQAAQDERLRNEFERRMDFEKAKTAADDARQDKALDAQIAGDLPFVIPGGVVSPAQAASGLITRAPASPQAAPPPGFGAGGSPNPGFTIDATDPLPTPPPELPADPAATPGPVPDLSPAAGVDPGALTPPDVKAAAAAQPSLTPAPGPVTPAQQVLSNLRELQAAGIPVTRNMLKSSLPSMISSATAAQRRATTAGGTSADPVSTWPINDRGYRFNPDNPEMQFMERRTPKGTTFSQVKTTDPGYGLKPVGEGLFEDENGQQYFVEGVKNGKPSYKRVEEDSKVDFRTKDANGRVFSFNQFGAQVAVTPEGIDFLTPKSKPMVGSDGQVYVFDGNKQGFINPPPAGVTFDGGKAKEAKKMMVGSDGQLYAFNREGVAMTPVPEGVRFDKPKDPDAVAHWAIDQKTGDLHGFNFKGEKIAETPGDYSKQTAAATGGKTSMNDDSTFAALEPKVRAMWLVNDNMAKAGFPATTPDAELIASGEAGRNFALARKTAQDAAKAVMGQITKGKVKSAEVAEGFVKGYLQRKSPTEIAAAANPGAPSAPPAVQPPAAAPAPVAPAPAAPVTPAAPVVPAAEIPAGKKAVTPALVEELNNAIKAGKPRAALLKRLEEKGYDVSGLSFK